MRLQGRSRTHVTIPLLEIDTLKDFPLESVISFLFSDSSVRKSVNQLRHETVEMRLLCRQERNVRAKMTAWPTHSPLDKTFR